MQAGQHPPDEPINPGAQVTKGQSVVLFLQYIMKHRLTGDQLKNLCKLFDIHLPNVLPKSKYLFNKNVPVHLHYDIHIYCDKCKGPLGKVDDAGQ